MTGATGLGMETATRGWRSGRCFRKFEHDRRGFEDVPIRSAMESIGNSVTSRIIGLSSWERCYTQDISVPCVCDRQTCLGCRVSGGAGRLPSPAVAVDSHRSVVGQDTGGGGDGGSEPGGTGG